MPVAQYAEWNSAFNVPLGNISVTRPVTPFAVSVASIEPQPVCAASSDGAVSTGVWLASMLPGRVDVGCVVTTA